MSSHQLPTLVAFVDGLKYESVERMPFPSSLAFNRRIRTDLGYSVTCHATMYSGVYPQKHGMWFVWKYSPETSLFRWLPDSQLLWWIDSLPTRYAVGKMTWLFSDNSSYAGIATMKRSALWNWRYFDLAESKLWNEPIFLESALQLCEYTERTARLFSGVQSCTRFCSELQATGRANCYGGPIHSMGRLSVPELWLPRQLVLHSRELPIPAT